MNTKTKHWASITAGILSLAGYASAASLGSEKYTYDASGNIIEKSIDGKVTKMSYNASNDLQSVQHSGNQDECLGNDSNGRTDSYLDKNSMSSRKIDYGYMDKVLQAKSPNGEATFLYDADGRLVGKSVQGAVISFIWDGSALAAEGLRVFTNEAHAVGGVSIIAGNHSVVISDYLGSTLSEGSRQFHGTAYGEGLEFARFTGKPFVEELGNFVFPHRLYSPALSRWTTPDPSGHPDGINNVIYGGNDPATNVDPSGLAFFYFDQQNLQYCDGSGYSTEVVNSQTVGKLTLGTATATYAAVSNPDPQNKIDGMSPNGWYTIGSNQLTLGGLQPNGSSEADYQTGGRTGSWTQGAMTQWSANGQDNYSSQTANNTVYQTLSKSGWKLAYGGNFIGGNLVTGGSKPYRKYDATDKYDPGDEARTYGDLKVHPDGGSANTSGCVGISNYVDCVAFIGNAAYRGKQLHIPEQ